VRAIREDPVRRGLLYAGTEYGMYVSFDDGRAWQPLQLNLPVSPVTDLQVHRGDLVVATQGRSFWILDDLSPLRQLELGDDGEEPRLFRPADAYRARVSGGGPEGRPSGAILYYYLPEQAERTVALEIMDAAGEVLRTYTWELETEGSDEESDFERTLEGDSIAGGPGLHRANWDLRLGRPDLLDEAVIWGFTGGPQVVPGSYQVRLTIGDWSDAAPLEVLPDPRLDLASEARSAQFDLMIQIRGSLQESHRAVERLRAVRSQLEDRAERAKEAGFGDDLPALADSAVQSLTRIEEQLIQTKNESGQDPLNFPPMLDNQLAYLYGYVGFSDGAPTDGAADRYEDLAEELSSLLVELDEAIAGPVARFTEALEEREVPAIIVPPLNPETP
jgi:hypothetical protein